MPRAPDSHAIAAEMRSAQDAIRQVAPFSARLPGFDLATAYEVAGLMHRTRLAEGERPVGRKLGFTNPEMWARFGVQEPVWAYIYDTTVVHLADTLATCDVARFAEPRIEPEIVFGFRTTPQPEDGLSGILDAIEWVAHGFEIVQSHFPGWRFQAADTVVDCALHGTLLIGPRQDLSRLGTDPAASLQGFALTLSRDGSPVETGRGSNVLGSPLRAISHLMALLEQQADCEPLQAGEIVTTGTITTAQPVHAGEVWESRLQGIPLPGLRLAFSG